jgi:hypothetical protein
MLKKRLMTICTKLPFPTFKDGDRIIKTEILFNYFKTRYAKFGTVA